MTDVKDNQSETPKEVPKQENIGTMKYWNDVDISKVEKIELNCSFCGCYNIIMKGESLNCESCGKDLFQDNQSETNIPISKGVLAMLSSHKSNFNVMTLDETIKKLILYYRSNENQNKQNKRELGKLNWGNYCAIDNNRNQCSEKNCTIFPICKIKNANQEKCECIFSPSPPYNKTYRCKRCNDLIQEQGEEK